MRSSEEGSLCWRSFFNAVAAFLRAYILHEISLGSIPTLTLLVFPQESQDYGFNPLTIDDEQIDVVQLLAANIERLEEKIAEAEANRSGAPAGATSADGKLHGIPFEVRVTDKSPSIPRL